ncbi:MAG: type II secretion system protein GspL [Pseudomonadota bacterium]
MSQTLFIGLDDLTSTDAWWGVFDDQGNLHGRISRGDVSAASASAQSQRTAVIVGPTNVTRTHCDLPVSGRKLLQALPFALEEQFATDVESLHFAAGDPDEHNLRPVLAVERSGIAALLSRLLTHGIDPVAVYSLHDGLAPIDRFLQLLVCGDHVLFVPDKGDAVAMQGVSPVEFVETWQAMQDQEDDDLPPTVRAYVDDEGRDQFGDALGALSAQSPPADVKSLENGWFGLAARTLAVRPGVNLRQGDYAPSRDTLNALRPWRYAAMLVLVAGLLAFGVRIADYQQLKAENARLDAAMVETLRQIRGARVDPIRAQTQLQALLQRAGGSRGSSSVSAAGPAPFLSTLSVFAGATDQNGELDVDGISYRNGIFDIQLTAPNAGALEALTKSVADAGGLQARIQRTEQQGERVKSFVQIQAGSQ